MEANYQYSRNAKYNKTVKLGEYTRMRCFSKKALKKEASKGSYEIVGAIGEGLTDPVGQYLYGTEERFYYSPKQSAWGHSTVGYVQVGKNEYFAVVKKTKRPLLILLTVLLAAIALTALLFMRNGGSLIDGNVVDYTPPASLNIDASENSIAIPGYSDIYVEAGTKDAELVLWNPSINPCYFKYTITAENGDVLYESKLVPPGKGITEVELTKRIPEGEQTISIRIETFSLADGETQMNGGVVQCKLIGYAQ